MPLIGNNCLPNEKSKQSDVHILVTGPPHFFEYTSQLAHTQKIINNQNSISLTGGGLAVLFPNKRVRVQWLDRCHTILAPEQQPSNSIDLYLSAIRSMIPSNLDNTGIRRYTYVLLISSSHWDPETVLLVRTYGAMLIGTPKRIPKTAILRKSCASAIATNPNLVSAWILPWFFCRLYSRWCEKMGSRKFMAVDIIVTARYLNLFSILAARSCLWNSYKFKWLSVILFMEY